MLRNNTNKFSLPIALVERHDLLQLVKKNKRIPKFLNLLNPHHLEVQQLKTAINEGRPESEIWNNPNCNLYLIYLIQKELIPYWQGITAYVYLIAKMQYTSSQDLKAIDQDVKFNYQVDIVFLVEAGKVTELGCQYLLGVVHALEKFGIKLSIEQLMTYVLALPRIEQWLIKTEFNHHTQKNNSDHLVWILSNNLAFLQKISGGCYEDPSTFYLVPSSSLINYFLHAMNENPMQMRPVLGNVGLKTLYDWHRHNWHPVSLYAPQIQSNPEEADGFRCGPFPMWLHDIGHTFWASLLTESQRAYIFTTYIPALRGLGKIAEACNDKFSLELLKEIERKAYDFDLTAVIDYAKKSTRYATYLAHTLGKNPNYPNCLYTGIYEHAPIGRAEGDTLYFLLHYGLYAAASPDAYKEVYRTLISFISTGRSYRDQRAIIALQTLAKNAAIDSEDLFAHAATKRSLIHYLEKQQAASTKIGNDRHSNANIEPRFQSQFFSIHKKSDSNVCSSSMEVLTINII